MNHLPRWLEHDGPDDADLRAALLDAQRGPSEETMAALAAHVASRMSLPARPTPDFDAEGSAAAVPSGSRARLLAALGLSLLEQPS